MPSGCVRKHGQRRYQTRAVVPTFLSQKVARVTLQVRFSFPRIELNNSPASSTSTGPLYLERKFPDFSGTIPCLVSDSCLITVRDWLELALPATKTVGADYFVLNLNFL